jgi:Putative zinc-finger
MNKTCNINQELISAYIDGELAGKEKQEIETHLRECEVCNDLLKYFKYNDMLTSQYIKNTIPSSSWDQCHAELKNKISFQEKISIITKYILPAAAIILCAIGGYYIIRTIPAPHTENVVATIVPAQYQDVLKMSESVLIGIANISENNSSEALIYKNTVLQLNLVEKIRDAETETQDPELRRSLVKLDALFTMFQNDQTSLDIALVKAMIINTSMIEELRAKQILLHEVIL